MKEEKIKEILCNIGNFIKLLEDIDNAAHQIAELDKPPEEVLLSDEEIMIIFRKCGGRNNPAICDYDKEITQAQALKSQLFHKAERDKERRMIFEEIEKKCKHSNPDSYWTAVKNCTICLKVLKAKYGG